MVSPHGTPVAPTVADQDVAQLRHRVAQLHAELSQAQERARVAEEQLHRVYLAVREYKARQMRARQAADAAREAAEHEQPQRSGLYESWAVVDPSLDERLSEFLGSDFEHDRSRDWMLGD